MYKGEKKKLNTIFFIKRVGIYNSLLTFLTNFIILNSMLLFFSKVPQNDSDYTLYNSPNWLVHVQQKA